MEYLGSSTPNVELTHPSEGSACEQRTSSLLACHSGRNGGFDPSSVETSEVKHAPQEIWQSAHA